MKKESERLRKRERGIGEKQRKILKYYVKSWTPPLPLNEKNPNNAR